MNGPAVVSIIILAAIAIAALYGLWHERRRCVDLEMELRFCQRRVKRYREHYAWVNDLVADLQIDNKERGL